MSKGARVVRYHKKVRRRYWWWSLDGEKEKVKTKSTGNSVDNQMTRN